MRFFLEVEISGQGEVWQLYNGNREKVTEVTDPTDPSVGRLVTAACRLDEAVEKDRAGADGPGDWEAGPAACKAWLLFTAPSP